VITPCARRLVLCVSSRADSSPNQPAFEPTGDVPLTLVNCKKLKQLFISNNCLDGLGAMNRLFRDKFGGRLNVVL
jgi:hypothetical protein